MTPQPPEPAHKKSDGDDAASTDEVVAGTAPKPEQEVEPRLATPSTWLPTLVETFVAIVVALVIGAILIAVSDQQVLEAMPYFFSYPWDVFTRAGDAIWSSYSALVRGSMGSFDALGTTVERAAPLICAGLGVSMAFRAGMFNIGAQGQLMLGGLMAGYVGFSMDLPAGIHLIAALLAGLVGGALWGAISGLLKATTGAHEVITTIMLNYLAASVLLYALSKDAFQRPGSDNALSPPVNDSAMFPQIGDFHLGVILAFAAVAACWWLLERSTLGFEMRAVGANPDAARTAGMSVARTFTLGMLVAGLLAGLAATMNVLGQGDSLSSTFAGTIGFDAITVALLGRATPLGTMFAGLLFGALSVGGVAMQASPAATPKELAAVIQALIVLFVAAPLLVRGMARLKGPSSTTTVQSKGWGA
jgi:ABC-type uncharacterized transport system permease subunit